MAKTKQAYSSADIRAAIKSSINAQSKKKPKEPDYKTWSEIKLRNPEPELCKALEDIMKRMGHKTASKAIEWMIQSFPRMEGATQQYIEQITDLRQKLQTEKEKVAHAEYKLMKIRSAYHLFNGLMQDLPETPKDHFENQVKRNAFIRSGCF